MRGAPNQVFAFGRILLVFLPLFVFSVPFASAQVSTALTPETRAAIESGLREAKKQNWQTAIGHFMKVVKTAKYPPAPPPLIYFNLGFAHDQIGGQEYRAMAYYRAYLAVAPNARNAKAVHNRITELKLKIMSNAKKLLTLIEKVAPEFPPKTFERKSANEDIVESYAIIGEVNKALTMASRFDEFNRPGIYYSIALTQSEDGDIAGAKKTITRIKSAGLKAAAYQYIAIYQARDGDTGGALKTVAQMPHLPGEKYKNDRIQLLKGQVDAYKAIVERLVKDKDMVRAKSIILRAKQTADQIRAGKRDKYLAYALITGLWLKWGDIQKAFEAASLSKPNREMRNYSYGQIATAYAAAGRIKEARQTLERVDRSYKAANSREDVNRIIDNYEKAKQAVEDAPNEEARKKAEINLRSRIYPIGPNPPRPTKLSLGQSEALFWDYKGRFLYTAAIKDYTAFVQSLGQIKKKQLSQSLATAIRSMKQKILEFNRHDIEWALKRRLAKSSVSIER